MSRTSTILTGKDRPQLVLIKYPREQISAPLLRYAIRSSVEARLPLLLVSLLHPPSVFIGRPNSWSTLHLLDFSCNVPGYLETKENEDICNIILTCIGGIPGPLTVIFDSISTLAEDLDSISQSYRLLRAILSEIGTRPSPGSLILYLEQDCPLLPSLQTSAFSPSLTEIVVHTPALLSEAAANYLTLPPPKSPESKFWSVLHFMARRNEGLKLIFGSRGPGCSHIESILEIVERFGHTRPSTGVLKQSVSRNLEAWTGGGPSEFHLLSCLSALEKFKPSREGQGQDNDIDPSYGLPFNVALTPDQQAARSQVPLPYLHQGSHIIYDPDSADDLDDEDPDEDLDI